MSMMIVTNATLLYGFVLLVVQILLLKCFYAYLNRVDKVLLELNEY